MQGTMTPLIAGAPRGGPFHVHILDAIMRCREHSPCASDPNHQSVYLAPRWIRSTVRISRWGGGVSYAKEGNNTMHQHGGRRLQYNLIMHGWHDEGRTSASMRPNTGIQLTAPEALTHPITTSL
ncbi:hypothetical protein BHE74_00028337 [Ensete ventricosum]|nr:hypothetical protein BHE74_00028337 [Ensete ventricosum]